MMTTAKSGKGHAGPFGAWQGVAATWSSVFRDMKGILDHYQQHKKEIRQQVEDAFRQQMEQALAQQTGQKGWA